MRARLTIRNDDGSTEELSSGEHTEWSTAREEVLAQLPESAVPLHWWKDE